MSEDSRAAERNPLRRVSVIVRSWDGPNSRIGLEMDLTQMPWGPFDALGKRLSLILPADPGSGVSPSASESQIERALRHVEHAADRCGEFARLANGNQELWLRSQETWEWVRTYLTSGWVEAEVDGGPREEPEAGVPPVRAMAGDDRPADAPGPSPASGPGAVPLPSLPGAASTLQTVARALRATPLSVWRESMGPTDQEAPTREEAIQTLLGVARILSAGEAHAPHTGAPPMAPPGDDRGAGGADVTLSEASAPPAPRLEPTASHPEAADPDQVSFDFAKGYDEGYRMGRRVGLALGTQKGARQGRT